MFLKARCPTVATPLPAPPHQEASGYSDGLIGLKLNLRENERTRSLIKRKHSGVDVS